MAPLDNLIHVNKKRIDDHPFADPFKQFHLHGLSEMIPLASGQFAQWSTKSKCICRMYAGAFIWTPLSA